MKASKPKVDSLLRTPKQAALHETLKDPEFLANAQIAKLRVDAVRGEEVERVIAGLFKLDTGLIDSQIEGCVLYK